MKNHQVIRAAIFATAMLFSAPQIATALTADQVQAIAEKVTVLIPETNPDTGQPAGNGSGSIIAKQGNTYTILTANHVVCRDQNPVCQRPYQLKVKTHDGEEYTVNNSTIKKLPNLDLAIFQFTSDKNYQLATLANYDPKLRSERQVRLADGRTVREYGQFVFASGWPGINNIDITELKYHFSVGRMVPPDKIVGFKIRPVEEGYEAVYTSITFPGMSGGPVFDTDGRIIAVHGQNEGEKVYDESSQKKRRVQIGYSLSIPIREFLNKTSQTGIQLPLNVQTTLPAELNENELDSIGTLYILAWAEEQNTETETAIYWANQGNKFWRSLQPIQALEAYEKAIKIDANFYPVWYGRGLVKTFLGNYDEALTNYSRALEIINEKVSQQPQNNDLKQVQGWVQRLQTHIQPLATNTPQTQPQTPYAGGDKQPAPPPQPAPSIQQPPQPSPPAENQLLW
ncbi:tetratricopeptide repeat-containing serine protease family protein [Ancylothrix sp. C2]|uniref:tetratricopeptide repeat-containing S1 family peptidase n=1 Tax=Ancylothrix sp. D3o TaxID=2953691 RepID=UPI0021BB0A86|nr:tetratricopeptide repeat-containing serine protease family protein [Ancylothrix sp. D3o]MCT7949873.1 tetratricopeptide repeat-containing serine protease family protein [Ancylothrix sp. D3o]